MTKPMTPEELEEMRRQQDAIGQQCPPFARIEIIDRLLATIEHQQRMIDAAVDWIIKLQFMCNVICTWEHAKAELERRARERLGVNTAEEGTK